MEEILNTASMDVAADAAGSELDRVTDEALIALQTLSKKLSSYLSEQLAEVNGPLAQQVSELEDEAERLRADYERFRPRVASERRTLASDADRAYAEGHDAIAESKRQKAADSETRLQNILRRAEECERKAGELVERQRQNYKRVFAECYPTISDATVNVSISMVEMFDSVWAAILRHESMSGLPEFVRTSHKLSLTPAEHGEEKLWFESLRKWFGGRRQ